jgi:hypothetical protein
MEEGIKNYSCKLYSEILDVINSVLPDGASTNGGNGVSSDLQQAAGLDGGSGGAERQQQNPEEIKGYHQKQMHAWKNQRTQVNLRGGGANRDPMHLSSYYGQ